LSRLYSFTTMTEFAHDKIVPFKAAATSKKEQVAEMFDRIAFRYDFVNRFLSAGIDVGWRKKAIRQLEAIHPQTILDVATGTADMPLLLFKMLKPQQITGIDISEKMLEIGRQKIAAQHLQDEVLLKSGDSEAISFADASFDAVTVSFGVRNFAHLEKGLSEMHRVLRPGGKAVILEFSRPQNGMIRRLANLYCRILAPAAGGFISNNKEAYQYLNDSIEAFPEGNNFLKIMQQAGFNNVYRKPLTLGVCTIYCGEK
jgi:demethylmenaquinone methyltransferase / 2-methoxy-6-polyprenyl-1,4-benzoquinol methylase